MAETIKEFNRLTIHSKINNSTYYHLDRNDVERYPNKDQVVTTHTSDGREIKSLILTSPKEIIHTNH